MRMNTKLYVLLSLLSIWSAACAEKYKGQVNYYLPDTPD